MAICLLLRRFPDETRMKNLFALGEFKLRQMAFAMLGPVTHMDGRKYDTNNNPS
jgi:hypothetical protein